ncbi:RNA polymerase subunit sigma-24 [Putridiphycobacter roseus]|uniref:RNA polymerase subunit sigma-24 n=1 Tax=Putridiphycobacter roseus TaxID=2219161 RepID=A0A2W1NCA6_9FLAO|nr:sigma-70 family RNA polymerase sigma factor [Putridiphycobacter roseus]PZE16713.1 RNA polymerase subunit sigma-24 [Putridiphycobacter roseus]
MVKENNLSEKGKKDLALVEKALNGSQPAYAELMEKYRESIYYMMLKMVSKDEDAEDLTIEAFGKAFNRLHQYSPSFAFSTWLFKIASNNAIDFIRKKRIKVTSMETGFTNSDGEAIVIDVESSERDPEEVAIHAEKVKHMRNIVQTLKPRYRELIEKRYFLELSYEEIAADMDLPLGTVKAQLFRARAFLADLMEKTKDAI